MARFTINGFLRDGGAEALRRRENFTTHGSMRGEKTSGGYNWSGRLPVEFKAAFHNDDPDYVVYSYATPIAWHGKRGWVMPDTSYSVTTSKQQGRVRAALHGEGVLA